MRVVIADDSPGLGDGGPHTHPISDIVGLRAELDGLAADIEEIPSGGGGSSAADTLTTFSAAGQTNITAPADVDDYTVFVVSTAGSGTYTRSLALFHTNDPSEGSRVRVVVTLPASANPTIQLRDFDHAGTLLLTITNPTATADTAVALFTFHDGAYRLASATQTNGTASAGTKTYSKLTPRMSHSPAASFAQLNVRNNIPTLDFDAAADEAVYFLDVAPEGSTFTTPPKVRIFWAAATATSGDAMWEASLERMNTDMDADSFDTAATATTTTNATSGIPNVTEITLSATDSIAAGEMFRLRIRRLGTNGADTMTGDAQLICVEFRNGA